MTDLEISKALALAIGWTEDRIDSNALPDPDVVLTLPWRDYPRRVECWHKGVWKEFDYRDWNIIGPIAAKYDCFPSGMSGGDFKKAKAQNHTDVVKWEAFAYDYKRGTEQHGKWIHVIADTPQRAIALAVIAGAKP